MWEQIQSNKRKTRVLVVAMAVVLLGLGFVIGEAAAPGGGYIGAAIAFAIWFTMSLFAWFAGDNILLTMAGAKPIQQEDHPELYNVVEEMKIASGLDRMPSVYMVNDMAPNAFAVGRKPEKAAVAVTAGLLGKLNRDELQGVVAHEVGHIVNRDVLLMTMLATTLGTISIISEMFLRVLWYGGGSSSRYRSSSRGKGKGGGQLAFMIIAIVFAILAPLVAQLIYFAVSRKREYLADAQATVYTRYPEGLASALEKISSQNKGVERASKATAAMYIINPMKKVDLSAMTATHPPASVRIRILRSIGNTASYNAYQNAWKSNTDSGRAVGLPKSALSHDSAAQVREPTTKLSKEKSQRQQVREAGDLMRQFNDFIFLSCVCGMKFKLPPEYSHDVVECPKCQRINELPTAQMAQVAASAMAATAAQSGAKKVTAARRKKSLKSGDPISIPRGNPNELHSFKCICGKTKSLSPRFSGSKCRCGSCGQVYTFQKS
jgi:heat shock protein HtpX